MDQGETFLDVVPTDGNASYAGKTLTEISFTVEGVDKVTVFLVIRKDDTLTVRFGIKDILYQSTCTCIYLASSV